MCDHVKFPDGSVAWICGVRRTKQFCACGRAGELLCCPLPDCGGIATEVEAKKP